MKHFKLLLLVFLVVAMAHVQAGAQHAGDHSRHRAEMEERGNRVMGFRQTMTTHHFRLLEDGGSIEVRVNDPNDAVSKDHIRQHLQYIARAFSEGRFRAPVEIHGQTVPGVLEMQEMRSAINYRFEPLESGGRVRITTGDRKALEAVHEFLRFQIKEHETGDPLSVASK
jgi:hypothetical protein